MLSTARQGRDEQAEGTADPIAALADALWPYIEQRLQAGSLTLAREKEAVVMNRNEAAAYIGTTRDSLRKRRHPLLAARRLPTPAPENGTGFRKGLARY